MSKIKFGQQDEDNNFDPDAGAWAWGSRNAESSEKSYAAAGLIPIAFESFAKGGPAAPGSGGGGGGGSSTYTSGSSLINDASEFNIQISFSGSWTATLKQAFIDSADQLSKYITGDIPNVLLKGKVIDDISISAEMISIDGQGGILGQAGPTAIRVGSYLPATAIMQFDSADASAYAKANLFDDIVLHEMTHSIGFGSIWSYKGLIAGAGTATPTFTGANAIQAYNTLFGGVGAVPVEQDGGAGTRDAHWDEETFNNELMTGYIDNDNKLSYMTVASLADLGYVTVSGVNFSEPAFV